MVQALDAHMSDPGVIRNILENAAPGGLLGVRAVSRRNAMQVDICVFEPAGEKLTIFWKCSDTIGKSYVTKFEAGYWFGPPKSYWGENAAQKEGKEYVKIFLSFTLFELASFRAIPFRHQ